MKGRSYAVHTPDPRELYIFKAPVRSSLGPDKLMGAEAVPQNFQSSDAGAGADPNQKRDSADHRSEHLPASKNIAAAPVEV
jgi:oxalate decarboxylase